MSGLVREWFVTVFFHQAANRGGSLVIDVEELEADTVPRFPALQMNRRQMPDRRPHLRRLGALDELDGLDRPHRKRRKRLDQRSFTGEVADVQRLGCLDRTPEFTDDLEANGDSTVG
jgi:hypothetical protein